MVLSLVEVEYIVARMEICEAIWIMNFLVSLFGQKVDTTLIHYNNQSCTKLSKNQVFHSRSKHIEIRYNFIKYCI